MTVNDGLGVFVPDSCCTFVSDVPNCRPGNRGAGAMSDALKDYTRFEFSDGRWTREVYRKGTGPAVIVIHEMPGMHPLVVRFADHVAAAGMTVFLPNLFGKAGREVTP